MFVERAAEWVFLKQKVIYYIIFVTDVLEGAIQEFWGFSKKVYYRHRAKGITNNLIFGKIDLLANFLSSRSAKPP